MPHDFLLAFDTVAGRSKSDSIFIYEARITISNLLDFLGCIPRIIGVVASS